MYLKFQHTKVIVNDDTLKYVQLYKKELLKKIVKILDQFDIRYFIANGNLIEHCRGEPIIHDDDIDLRFNEQDFHKWMKYCLDLVYQPKYNFYRDFTHGLIFDSRAKNFIRQKKSGIQINLDLDNLVGIKSENKKILTSYTSNTFIRGIHADLVASNISIKPWYNQTIVFSEPLRKTTYLGIKNVSIPSKSMTDLILRQEYGDKYITPILNSERSPDGKYRIIDKKKSNNLYIYIIVLFILILFLIFYLLWK